MDIKLYLLWSLVFASAAVVLSNSPPDPDTSQIYFVVPENLQIGSHLITVKATDSDGGDTLTISTSTPETKGLVKMGPTISTGSNHWSCDVSLNSQLDRDYSPSSRQLYFSISDGTNSPTLKVTMVISDVNDNPPTFVGLPFRISIDENYRTGQVVYQISATDPDTAQTNITYYMKSAGVDYDNTFEMLPNGSLVLLKPLDYQTVSFYHYSVSAQDNGDPPCPGPGCQCDNTTTAVCNPKPEDLFITIVDVENTPPVFEKLPYIANVAEDENINFQILQVAAVDGDRGVIPPNRIKYSISGRDSTPFHINENNGVISVGKKLDCDAEDIRDKGGLYVFTVTATEISQNLSVAASNPNNSHSTQVSITVTDVNDNEPLFTSTSYVAHVQENTPKGVPIALNIEVHDNDQGINSRFWVYLEKDGQPYTDFETLPKQNSVIQGRSSITITVSNSSVLDYEKIQNITFKLIAAENNTNGLAPNSSEATVTLFITDINDNSPHFTSQQTQFNVAESETEGHEVTHVTAVDDDSGDFGLIIFGLEDDGANGVFNISSDGVIKVAKSLDREVRSSYTLAVVASDNFKAPEDQRRKSTQYIQITVTDVNDNPPVWSQFIPYVSLPESSAVGTTVTTLKALDLDSGPNSQIEYTIYPNTNGSGLFNINVSNDAAEIIITRSLINHFGLHIVRVVATDKGTPPLNATADLSIFVIDENQHYPVFINPDQNVFNSSAGIIPTITVPEEQPLDSVLYNLTATDDDSEDNGEVEYYLDLTTNKDYEYFTVDRVSGALKAAGRLDRDTKETYEIAVRAQDKGHPVQLDTSLRIRIKLLDIDDNEPQYTSVSMPQVLQVTEENDTADIGLVYPATDIDSDPNNQTCYYLYGGDHINGLNLDKKSRKLSLTKKVDKEVIGTLNIVIKASENCTLDSSTFISVYNDSQASASGAARDVPLSFNSSDHSLLWVQVVVIDINDNPPRFLSHDLSVGTVFDVDIGTEVLSLAKTTEDRDTPPNSRNMYKLLSISSPPEAAANPNTYREAFVVSANGSVSTNMRFQSDVAGYFLLRALVYDNDGNNDTANVKIYLISNAERLKLVFNKVPNEVEGFKVTFIEQLSDTLNLDLALEKIQTHALPDGTIDPARTDAYIHGRYRDSGEVVPASKLWQLLDQNSRASSLLSSHGVFETKDMVEEQKVDTGEELRKVFIILIAVLSVAVVAMIGVLIHLVRLYRRRLRAATTTAHTSPKEKEEMEHPGTNLYFSAENPLFGKEIRHLDHEEDRTSHNSLDVNEVDEPISSKSSHPNEEQEIFMHFMDGNEDITIRETIHTADLDQVLHAFTNLKDEDSNMGDQRIDHRSLSSQHTPEGGIYDEIYDLNRSRIDHTYI